MPRKKQTTARLGVVTCPGCGHKQEMEMPLTSCLPFYECAGCGQLIQAEKSCCIFCDYGDRPCPVAALHG